LLATIYKYFTHHRDPRNTGKIGKKDSYILITLENNNPAPYWRPWNPLLSVSLSCGT